VNSQTSKRSAKRRVVEFEEEEGGYEEHSKISKKLSGSFSGSGRSFTPNPSSQKKSKISLQNLKIIMIAHTRSAI
jgi:hypothetical protein